MHTVHKYQLIRSVSDDNCYNLNLVSVMFGGVEGHRTSRVQWNHVGSVPLRLCRGRPGQVVQPHRSTLDTRPYNRNKIFDKAGLQGEGEDSW